MNNWTASAAWYFSRIFINLQLDSTMCTMKHKLLAAVFAALVTLPAMAQEPAGGFEGFLKQLWFPTEFGYSSPAQEGAEGGLVTRVSLEWRAKAHSGLCASAQIDTRFTSYKDRLPDGSNLSDADIKYDDYYLGAGYRVPFGDNFCLAAMLHLGGSNVAYQKIVPSAYVASSEEIGLQGSDVSLVNYSFDRITKFLPTAKITAFAEYYLAPDFCVFLTCSYLQHLQRSPLALSSSRDGAVLVSLGFTAAIF